MNPGRNDPCPCGSGKKYKHCCERKAVARPSLPAAELSRLGALCNAGNFVEAETRAHALLEQYPDEASLWNLLAMSLHMQGKDAVAAMQQAAQLAPNDAGMHNNLGNVLLESGQASAAIHSFQRAVQIKPNLAEAHFSLAAAFAAQGQQEQALQSYRRVIELQPNNSEAHNNLGSVLRDLGQIEQAIESYRHALKLQLRSHEVLCNLGVALRDAGRLDEAVTTLQQALSLQPDDVETLSVLGLVLHDLGKFAEAVTQCRNALKFDPNHAAAHNNLGLALQSQGLYEQSAASCRQAIALRPNFAEAHNNLGIALTELCQYQEGLTHFQRAVELRPDYFEAHSNLLFTLSYTASTTPAAYLAEALRYGASVASKVTRQFDFWLCDPQPQRLRIGFVSGDFCNHPVGYFTESLLAQLVALRIELFAYSSNPKQDDLTARIRPHFTTWRDVYSLSDEQTAQRIHQDGIHILIDLAGHTAKNCLPAFAWKPAPVQFSWLGYFASTGVAAMDYLLADQHILPVADEGHFSEAIWRLPNSYLCFTPPNMPIQTGNLPALANGHVTFGSFNNLTKMNEAVIALWARVLLAVPESRLFLKTKQLNDAQVCDTVRAQFAAHGVNAERLLLEGASPRAELLAAYQRMDIALDSFPYPGGTTSVEALWMGVPVLTRCGDRFLSHMGESILNNAGLPDWIARNDDDYVTKAAAHAADLNKLAALRARLRQQVLASPLFDAPCFAANFEQALWGMWQNWRT